MKFNIPKSTIHDHIKHQERPTKGGQPTILNKAEEEEIVDWINGSIARGVPPGSLDVIDAGNLVIQRRLGSAAQVLTRGWLEKFNKRHKLTYRVADKLNKASANITQQNIEGWFHQTSNYIIEHPEILEAMMDENRVVNADESMVRLSSSAARVIAPKGVKNLYEVTKNDKFGLTVMAAFKANGKGLKPFIIYPQERVSKAFDAAFPSDQANYAVTKSGWMDSTTFCQYLETLEREIREEGTKFPVILLLDNHSSHTSLEAAETAENLGIKLIFLYPNSTHLLQPADIAIFRCMKSLWRKENRVAKRDGVNITKQNFAPLFLTAFSKIPSSVIRNGFFKSGIFPWNSNNVDYSKCLGKKSAAQSLRQTASSSTVSQTSQVLNLIQPSIQFDLNDTMLAMNAPIILMDELLTFSHSMTENEEVRSYEEIFDDVSLTPWDPIMEQQEFIQEEEFTTKPTLQLPPTPQRSGKRQIKKTHPVQEANIEEMRGTKIKKLGDGQEKLNRKNTRLEKKKTLLATQIQKATLRKEKQEKALQILLNKHQSL